MEDSDNILKALRNFSEEKPETFPAELETYIGRIASTGETLFPWHEVKDAFTHKMQLSIDQFVSDESQSDKTPALPNVENVSCDEMKKRVLTKINDFANAPFTVQRLAELMMNPRKHYKKAIKWLRGLEKNVNVVSTVDPFGTKIVNEAKLVNGVDSRNGLDDSALTSPERTLLPPPPVNSPATSIPGWFNMAGNGDGWPAAARSASSSDESKSESLARSDSLPMQNGTKRLKTHHTPSVAAEGGDSTEAVTTTTTATTGATAAAEENTDGEASSDSQSLSEASEASSSSPEPSDAARTENVKAASPPPSADSSEEKSMDADTTTTSSTSHTEQQSTAAPPTQDSEAEEVKAAAKSEDKPRVPTAEKGDEEEEEGVSSGGDVVSTSQEGDSEQGKDEASAESPLESTDQPPKESTNQAAVSTEASSDQPKDQITSQTEEDQQKDQPMEQESEATEAAGEISTTTTTSDDKPNTDSAQENPNQPLDQSEQSMETD